MGHICQSFSFNACQLPKQSISFCACLFKCVLNTKTLHLACNRWHFIFFKLQVIKHWLATQQRNQYVVARLLKDFFFKDSMLFASYTGYWGMWNFGLGVLVLFSWIPKSGSSARQRREVFSCFNLLDTKTCLVTTTSWTWCPSHLVICYCTSLWLLFLILQYFILLLLWCWIKQSLLSLGCFIWCSLTSLAG